MSIGERVKSIRESQQMTQSQLAKIAGISQAGLSDIENTTKSPNANTLRLIASALGVSVSVLYGEEEINESDTEVRLLARDIRDLDENDQAVLKQMISFMRKKAKEAPDK